jgi:hypothetical protein
LIPVQNKCKFALLAVYLRRLENPHEGTHPIRAT